MGNTLKKSDKIEEKPDRKIFVTFKQFRQVLSEYFGSFIVFTFVIRYQRYKWEVDIRFNELIRLDRKLFKEFPSQLSGIQRPPKYSKLFWQHDQKFLIDRANMMNKYLQDLLDHDFFINNKDVRKFLACSIVSFQPDFGRKGKEGYLKKCSGGYIEKFSRKTGDFINVWKWRWIILTDAGILWFRNPDSKEPLGFLQMDQDFTIVTVGRVLTISTATRRLLFYSSTLRGALEWTEEIKRFYAIGVPRAIQQNHSSSFPPRPGCHAIVYTLPRDYFQSLTIALLGAQKEIFITSWKNSPNVLLTRPPLPPLRLDQILKYKANQGVNVYVLLYKEVEYIGQSNDSFGVKKSLENLSPNIHVIRHPNKFIGGSTAVLWSHHEKLVVVDRNVAFVGGIDVSFNRWDDEHHRIADEDGLIYPGNDYRQPAHGVFKPVRSIDFEKEANDSDEEMIQVEIAVGGESLPQAMSAVVGDDNQTYEVDVVVDFSMTPQATLPPPTATSSAVNHTNHSTVHQAVQRGSGEQKTAGPDEQHLEDADKMSEVSDNWAEDRHQHLTDAELQAMQQSPTTEQQDPVERGSFFGSFKETISMGGQSVVSTFSTVSSSFMSFGENAIKSYREQKVTVKKMKKSGYWEQRDLYPRMAWHDIHSAVSGSIARDVASHFVQRWNHHRLSSGSHHQPLLVDITDNLTFTQCARCDKGNIMETCEQCPYCGYDLGEVNSYSRSTSIETIPTDPSRFSYLTFECSFSLSNKLPFRMHGDCPVVLTSILSALQLGKRLIESEGRMVESCGPMADWLHAFGLFPAIGDIVVAVNGMTVTQLNSNQIKRFIKRIRRGVSQHVNRENPEMFTITFRRHYLESLYPDDKRKEDYDTPGELIVAAEQKTSNEVPISASNMATAPPVSSSSDIATQETKDQEEKLMSIDCKVIAVDSEEDKVEHVRADGSSSSAAHDALVAEKKGLMNPSSSSQHPQSSANSGGEGEEAMISLADPTVTGVAEVIPAEPPSPARTAADYHPICQAAAQREVSLAMSQLYHQFSRQFDLVPRLPNNEGTCNVQLLRSVGKWSIGTKTESSIWNAYIDAIRNAHRFIYIENQFFIGSNAGDGVQNTIPQALVDRILRAYESKQEFRVIILIPLHPNGDFCDASKAKVVMHYEYATINRGVNSMIEQLKKKAPNINIQNYLSFYCLRNWGIINNKVVTEQIYVHCKLMIVDDRVVIVGSANINDRSMLGLRDSEVAIRIEDTSHLASTLAGQPHTVGKMPHLLRLKLMRQHAGDPNLDIVDILNPVCFAKWREISSRNSAVYDEIEGGMSVYRCNTIQQYKKAQESYLHRSFLDTEVQMSLSEIQGCIVDWPHNFFQKEDLSPSLATRALVPNELWY